MTLAAVQYAEAEASWLTPNGRPVTFRYRVDTNDWNTVNSCLGESDEYHFRGRTFDGTVLDIGGYLGSVGIAVAVDNPDVKVVIVEPVPDNADLIEQNAVLNGVSDRVTVYRGAVGPRGTTQSEIRYRYVGDFSLEHHAFVGNTSLAYPNGGDVQHETLSVETLGLAALLDRFGITEPSLVKIDCEGGEWPFFKTATQATLKRLPLIVGEAHPIGEHLVSDIEKALGKTHHVTTTGWLFEAKRR